MELKDLIGFALLLVATLVCIVATLCSLRLRDIAFFLMIAGAVVTDRLDINFFTHFWYRGTTRGLEVSFLDVLAFSLLVSSLLSPRPGEKRIYKPASFGLMILFFIYAGFTVLISEPRAFGLFELSKMFRGLIFFLAAAMFVRSSRELHILVLALCCAVCFEGIFSIQQRWLQYMHRIPGTLEHPNSFSMYLCLVAPIFVAAASSNFPRYLRLFSLAAIASAALCSVLTISRAGIPIFGLVMAGAAVMCVSWKINAKTIGGVVLVLLCTVGLVYKAWDNIAARFGEATFEEEYMDKHSQGRGYYLRLAKLAVEDHPFGFGLNNWSYWVSKKYGKQLGTPYENYDGIESLQNKDYVFTLNYAAPAHNLAALTVGELGIPGLLIFAVLWARWFQMGLSFFFPRVDDPMRRLGVGLFFCICGIFLQSMTEWTYRQTHIFVTFHILMGTLASLYYIKKCEKLQLAEAGEPVAETDYEIVVEPLPQEQPCA